MTPAETVWNRVIKPEPEIEPWEWLEQNVLAIPYSPMSGGLDTGLDPLIREVLRIVLDPANSLVVILCAVQRFKTVVMELAIAWKVVNDPSPTMFFQDIDPNAKDEMDTRLMPLFENTMGVRDLIPRGADKDKAKKTVITFRNGMNLWVLGANNPRNTQRRSVQAVFMDECWQLHNNQNAIRQAAARTTRAHFPKVVLASQGSEEDGAKGAEFVEYFNRTDKRIEQVACPHCGEYQPMELKFCQFEPLKDADGEYDFPAIAPTVHFECQHCAERWENDDATRFRLRQTSRLVATNPNAEPGSVGIVATAWPFMDWAVLIAEYLRAKSAASRGDIAPLKVFYQKRLAQNWVNGDGEDFTFEITGSGYEMANATDGWDECRIRVINRKVGILPRHVTNLQGTFPARSMVADVQQDCFWINIRSWGHGGKTRLLKVGKAHAWSEIKLLEEAYGIHPTMVFIDSGDKPNDQVYPMCAKYGWTCLRGDGAESFKHTIRPKSPDERPKIIARAYSMMKFHRVGKVDVRIIHWSNLAIKDQLARLINMPEVWQTGDDIDDHCKDYRQQMDSERRSKSRTGKPMWKQVGKRPNHIWDTEAMQGAVGNILKIIGGEVVPEAKGEE